jgi:hypothetical protein
VKLQFETWPIERCIDYARNPRKNDHAVDKVAAAIREFGFRVPIVAKSDGLVVDGHLRLKAAKKLGLTEVPVILADDMSEAQIKAFRLSVNKVAELAQWDMDLLKLEIQDLEAQGFDLTLTGFELGELSDLFAGLDPDAPKEGLSENYSRKIEAPIYEITGKCPSVPEMMDRAKTETLQAEIECADLPADVRAFLHFAAERHTVFNFRNIAEFYAHADADTQDLMERSALVIIDFNRAIEEGFVQLSQELMDLAGQEHG